MRKLLLVDDEPLVLVGLQGMLPWEEYGIEICATARNGLQAMQLIEQKRPDIVIADIMMPVQSGLELLHACREKFGRVPLFIILTSVEKYQFAREALSGQAVEYLVKLELTPETLGQAIKKAVDILCSMDTQKSANRIPASDRPGINSFYDRFFTHLFNNLFENKEQFVKQQLELGVDFSFDSYVTCYCKINILGKQDISSDRLIGLYTSTSRMAWETITRHMACYVTNLELGHFAITFCLSEQDVKDYQNVIENVLLQTILILKNYFNVSLTCGVGKKVDSPLAICDSFRTSRYAFAACEMKSISFYKGTTNKTIDDIMAYIESNLEKRITLNQTAAIFGFNSNYLSQLFSKHAGCSFIDYVSTQKINKAKLLLSESDVKVYEISEKLGFESAFYFSNVFKKYTGLSPREYIRRQVVAK